MSRDLRKLERLETRLSRLEEDIAPAAAPKIRTIIIESAPCGRQQLEMLCQVAERKGLKRDEREACCQFFPYLLPPELVAGMESIDAGEFLSLLHRYPREIARPQPQP